MSQSKNYSSIIGLRLTYFCQALWFPLLETMMSAQKKVKEVEDKRHVEGKRLIYLTHVYAKDVFLSVVP